MNNNIAPSAKKIAHNGPERLLPPPLPQHKPLSATGLRTNETHPPQRPPAGISSNNYEPLSITPKGRNFRNAIQTVGATG